MGQGFGANEPTIKGLGAKIKGKTKIPKSTSDKDTYFSRKETKAFIIGPKILLINGLEIPSDCYLFFRAVFPKSLYLQGFFFFNLFTCAFFKSNL